MMMFDFNPWTSLFLLQALRMTKKPLDARARRREQIAQMNRHRTGLTEPVARPSKLPPPPVRQKPTAPRRGWRYAFRTDAARTKAASAPAESRSAA